MSEDQLREKCLALAPAGDAVAAAVLRLFADRDKLREQVAGHCERIAAQSDLLAKAAERQADRDKVILAGLNAGLWLGEQALRQWLTGSTEDEIRRIFRDHVDMKKIHGAVALVKGQ